jgi:amidase
MNWLNKSIMHTRGLARGEVGKTHELTEARQGKFHYTIGPYSDPVMRIAPGDRVIVDTLDAFEGKLKTEDDLPSKHLRVPFMNPQCGPIMIEGAKKGDVVAVYIESMLPRGDNPRGTCCLIPGFGGLTGTNYTATLNEPLPEITRKIDLDEEQAHTPAIQAAYRHAQLVPGN